MKNIPVIVPPTKRMIVRSPGFEKKGLATYKIDAMALCGFGCRYCSSNSGNYLRVNRERFRAMTVEQVGIDVVPATAPELTFEFPDPVEALSRELDQRDAGFGAGEVLVASQLTDLFSPRMVSSGTARRILETLVDRTSFRIRVLTKNACVGSREWVEFLSAHADRFVVGLSIGTTDDAFARRLEVGTSPPTARIRAYSRLQDAGVPTFGMLCPVMPDMVGAVGEIVHAIGGPALEEVWVEPYNDRDNWRIVAETYLACYADSPVGRGDAITTAGWLATVFDDSDPDGLWSRYATDLFEVAAAVCGNARLNYLLYEGRIRTEDVGRLDLDRILLQDRPDDDGLSKNPAIRVAQIAMG